MDILNIVTIPAITGVVFLAIMLIRQIAGDSEKAKRWIPSIAGVLGAALGVAAFFMGGILPAENVFVAILIGAASGFAATGTHQVFKQLTKGDKE